MSRIRAVEPNSARSARTFTVAILALYFIAAAIITIVTWNDQAWYGWNLGPDSQTVMTLTPGYPAEMAGLKVGDRVVWQTMPLAARADAVLQQTAPLDPLVTMTVVRGGQTRTISMRGKTTPVSYNISVDVSVLATCIVAGIALALVLLRPTRMTWGFLLALVYAAIPPVFMRWGQQSIVPFVTMNTFFGLFFGLQAAGTLTFMSRFPGDVPRGALAFIDRFALPFGAIVALLWLYLVVALVLPGSPPPLYAAVLSTQYIVPILVVVCAMLALLTTLFLTKGSDRQRVFPVLALFGIFAGGSALNNIFNALIARPVTGTAISIVLALVEIALAVAIAHGIIKHRVIDVSFVISRTLVYTMLTSLIVAVFALVDFLSSKLLERFQITIVIEALVALGFGIWLNTLHARIDRFVDRVFFRRRHLAEERLERAARVLSHAESAEFVDESLVVEPVDGLELASAAVFRCEDERFERVAASGWHADCTAVISTTDALVVHLRAELEPLDLSSVRWQDAHVPGGLAQPLLAVPLVVRHEVLGFALYGGHRGGEALDPDEIRALSRLAVAAAGAYDHIEATTLRRRIESMETENAQLRHGEELMRQMMQALRGAAGSVES